MLFRTLASGSTGNAAILSARNTNILLDAGISARRIVTNLRAQGIEKLGAILITHEHTDHIKGLRVLLKHINAPVYAPNETALHMINNIEGLEGRIIPFTPGNCFEIGEIDVNSFATPHDSASSCGYSFFHGRHKVTSVTDFGHITQAIEAAIIGSDILMVESNHDEELLRNGPYPFFLKKRVSGENGHLSNGNCAALAAKAVANGTQQIILAHLSRQNNTPALAEKTVKQALISSGADTLDDFKITVASPDTPGDIHILD